MVISSFPNLIDKNIIYGDNILYFEGLDRNIKITNIPNVTEDELKNCLKKIIEGNPNIIFNTIQYSKAIKEEENIENGLVIKESKIEKIKRKILTFHKK